MSYGETAQNEVGFGFIDAISTGGVQSLLNAADDHFYSNYPQYRATPESRPAPGHMFLRNEGQGDIRYLCGGPNQNTQPTDQIGMLLKSGETLDWTNVQTDYTGLIRNFQYVVVSSGSAVSTVLSVSWRD